MYDFEEAIFLPLHPSVLINNWGDFIIYGQILVLWGIWEINTK